MVISSTIKLLEWSAFILYMSYSKVLLNRIATPLELDKYELNTH